MLTLLLADGRLPVGGHTASAGLEAALQAGWDESRVREYLALRLRTTARVDAGTAVVTAARLGSGAELATVQQAWAARTPSEQLRNQSITLGKGYLRLLRRAAPRSAALQALMPLTHPGRPIVMGALGAAFGLSAAQIVQWVAYDEIASITSAALKLIPLDPLDTVEWAVACAPVVQQLVFELLPLTDPGDIPAGVSPLLEAWQHDHATRTHKLFVS